MMVSIIVAMGENGAIGKDNRLLWKLSDDLQFFKTTTLGHHLVMGRKTYESIGRPLPGRTTIVLSRTQSYPNTLPARSLDEAICMARDNSETELFVCGGADIYAQALPLAQRLIVTHVEASIDADAFFPEVDWTEWHLIRDTRFEQSERNEIAFRIGIYERR